MKRKLLIIHERKFKKFCKEFNSLATGFEWEFV